VRSPKLEIRSDKINRLTSVYCQHALFVCMNMINMIGDILMNVIRFYYMLTSDCFDARLVMIE
jgi:hypothetical protein